MQEEQKIPAKHYHVKVDFPIDHVFEGEPEDCPICKKEREEDQS